MIPEESGGKFSNTFILHMFPVSLKKNDLADVLSKDVCIKVKKKKKKPEFETVYGMP